MIYSVEGDILKSKAQVIAHGVAPHDHFQNGLALELRKEWPAMYKDFRHYCQLQNPKPGTSWAWQAPSGQKIVALFTQEPAESEGGIPGSASLSYVRHSLQELRKFLEKENIESVALPRVATGVGRLNWQDVEKIVRGELDEINTIANVYEVFRKGVAAEEKGVCRKCGSCECQQSNSEA